MSTLVNGGTRYAAHLLLRARDFTTGSDIFSSDTRVLSSFSLDEAVRREILYGMEDAVSQSAQVSRYMSGLPFTVAGKTGTAQTGAATDNGLFVCCAPSQNPGIVVATVIEKAGGGSYAAMSAGRVLEAYAKKAG